MRDQQGGPCTGADRGRRQNGSEGAVLTGLPQVSPRPGWRVAGGQGGARRFEVHGDVGQVPKRYNIVLSPTQHHPTIIVARFSKTSTTFVHE